MAEPPVEFYPFSHLSWQACDVITHRRFFFFFKLGEGSNARNIDQLLNDKGWFWKINYDKEAEGWGCDVIDQLGIYVPDCP